MRARRAVDPDKVRSGDAELADPGASTPSEPSQMEEAEPSQQGHPRQVRLRQKEVHRWAPKKKHDVQNPCPPDD